MKHRALLRHIDLLAAEHRFYVLTQPASLGKVNEKLDRLSRDAVFRIVEIKSAGVDGETLAPLGIIGEELSQM